MTPEDGSNNSLAVTTPLVHRLWGDRRHQNPGARTGHCSPKSSKRNSERRSRSPHPMEGCGTPPRWESGIEGKTGHVLTQKQWFCKT